MTREQFRKLKKGGHPRFYSILREIAELHARKNTDYAKGAVQGPLGNFTRVGQIMALYPGFNWACPFGVAISYMLKQLDAALVLCATKRTSITGEPVPTRMRDVMTYSGLSIVIHEEGGYF